MKIQSIAIILTVLNLAILTFLVAQIHPARAQQQSRQNVAPVLRARALEIVDSLGSVRASITLQPAVEVDGKKYPQTILFRLIDSKGKPLVKIGAAENGSGLTLINSADEGVIIHGHNEGAVLKLTHKGKERLIEP